MRDLVNMNIGNQNIQSDIESLIGHIKTFPMDIEARLALVQMYCLDANWEKALQLTDVVLKLRPDNHIEKLLKNNILCEIQRSQIFSGKQLPTIYCDDDFCCEQMQLLQQYHAHNHDRLLQIFEPLAKKASCCATIVTKSGENYHDDWLDSDFRLASIVEVFLQNQYYWLPLKSIRKIDFWQVEILTDKLWLRAKIQLINGDNFAAFIPARYPTSQNHSDEIKYCQITSWQEILGLPIAFGQKVITSGITDIALLDINYIEMSE